MSTTPVGKALEKVIWEVHQCEKILEHGAPSEDRLLDKLDHLVGVLPSLREAAKESEAADDDKGSATVFPVDILRHVDEGRNPVRFMVDAILAVGEANARPRASRTPSRSSTRSWSERTPRSREWWFPPRRRRRRSPSRRPRPGVNAPSDDEASDARHSL